MESMWSDHKEYWFEKQENFIAFLEKYGGRLYIEHEMAHAEKAIELGYTIIYRAVLSTIASSGAKVISNCSCLPLGEILLEDFVNICLAPKDPGSIDRGMAKFGEEEMKRGNKKINLREKELLKI